MLLFNELNQQLQCWRLCSEYLLVDVPLGSKSSKSSSVLFAVTLELWEGTELALTDDFDALDDVFSLLLLQGRHSEIRIQVTK